MPPPNAAGTTIVGNDTLSYFYIGNIVLLCGLRRLCSILRLFES
jgi:hypothetical protein